MSPRWNWDSPTPVCPPPRTKGWGGTLACCLRGGGVPIPTTGETLSTLPTLWIYHAIYRHWLTVSAVRGVGGNISNKTQLLVYPYE